MMTDEPHNERDEQTHTTEDELQQFFADRAHRAVAEFMTGQREAVEAFFAGQRHDRKKFN